MGTVDAVVEDFRRHGLVIWALALGSLIAYTALGIAKAWILGAYIAILAQILAYGVMEGKADVKRAAGQALLAWIASIVVGIALILAALVSALIAFALAGVSAALAVAVAAIEIVAIVAVAARFLFIPYYAHRSHGFSDMIRRSWELGWGTAIRTLLWIILAYVVFEGIAEVVYAPVIKDLATHIETAASSGVSGIEAEVIKTITAPYAVVLGIVALAVASIGVAASWLIVYHEAESNEKRVESSEEAVA